MQDQGDKGGMVRILYALCYLSMCYFIESYLIEGNFIDCLLTQADAVQWHFCTELTCRFLSGSKWSLQSCADVEFQLENGEEEN